MAGAKLIHNLCSPSHIRRLDEDDNSSNNRVPTIFVGSPVKAGSRAESINYYRVLRTMEDAYGLPYAGSRSTTTPITDVRTAAG
ncbi:MAG: hypothetical protein ABI808_11565 [Pseudonocardiales bacterium]